MTNIEQIIKLNYDVGRPSSPINYLFETNKLSHRVLTGFPRYTHLHAQALTCICVTTAAQKNLTCTNVDIICLVSGNLFLRSACTAAKLQSQFCLVNVVEITKLNIYFNFQMVHMMSSLMSLTFSGKVRKVFYSVYFLSSQISLSCFRIHIWLDTNHICNLTAFLSCNITTLNKKCVYGL